MLPLPYVGMALTNWFQPMTFKVLVKTIVDFVLVETETVVETQGVRQPMSPQELRLKPEGQRALNWESMYCLPDTVLKNDDIIIFNSVKYRVMKRLDWNEYGYLQYDIVRDYETIV
jgi:hypothetical protein